MSDKMSISVKNAFENKIEEILKKYAEETKENGNLYFIADVNENNEVFVLYKYEENSDSVLKVNYNELPENMQIGNILRFYNNKYVYMPEETEIVKKKIEEIKNNLIEKQNEVLKRYRKEGHLYEVTERINDSIFLRDITEDSNEEIEEIDFPEELLLHAWEGREYKFTNGTYTLC